MKIIIEEIDYVINGQPFRGWVPLSVSASKI